MAPRVRGVDVGRVMKKGKGKEVKGKAYPALKKALRSSGKLKESETTSTPTTTSKNHTSSSEDTSESSFNPPLPSSSPTTAMPATTIPASTSKSSTSKSTSPNTQPVYFWRPHDPNAYLGQWYVSPFTVSGSTYATAEMWMMVQKARLFNDEAIASEMLATTDPKKHKALGRRVDNFDEVIWDEKKLDIVTEGNYHKFTLSSDAENLTTMLLATGDRELVEASPMDKIWGIGFAERNAGWNRKRWGKNLLGVALMRVRERVREEKAGEREKGKGVEGKGKGGIGV